MGWGEEAVGREVLPAALHPHPAGGFKLPRLPPSSLASLAIHHLSPGLRLCWGSQAKEARLPVVEGKKVGWMGKKNEGEDGPLWSLLGAAPMTLCPGVGKSEARPGLVS